MNVWSLGLVFSFIFFNYALRVHLVVVVGIVVLIRCVFLGNRRLGWIKLSRISFIFNRFLVCEIRMRISSSLLILNFNRWFLRHLHTIHIRSRLLIYSLIRLISVVVIVALRIHTLTLRSLWKRRSLNQLSSWSHRIFNVQVNLDFSFVVVFTTFTIFFCSNRTSWCSNWLFFYYLVFGLVVAAFSYFIATAIWLFLNYNWRVFSYLFFGGWH